MKKKNIYQDSVFDVQNINSIRNLNGQLYKMNFLERNAEEELLFEFGGDFFTYQKEKGIIKQFSDLESRENNNNGKIIFDKEKDENKTDVGKFLFDNLIDNENVIDDLKLPEKYENKNIEVDLDNNNYKIDGAKSINTSINFSKELNNQIENAIDKGKLNVQEIDGMADLLKNTITSCVNIFTLLKILLIDLPAENDLKKFLEQFFQNRKYTGREIITKEYLTPEIEILNTDKEIIELAKRLSLDPTIIDIDAEEKINIKNLIQNKEFIKLLQNKSTKINNKIANKLEGHFRKAIEESKIDEKLLKESIEKIEGKGLNDKILNFIKTNSEQLGIKNLNDVRMNYLLMNTMFNNNIIERNNINQSIITQNLIFGENHQLSIGNDNKNLVQTIYENHKLNPNFIDEQLSKIQKIFNMKRLNPISNMLVNYARNIGKFIENMSKFFQQKHH